MNTKQLDSWVKKMGDVWEKKQANKIANLFEDRFLYYETPSGKPYTTKKEIIKLWEEVPNSQKDINFNHDIVICNKDLGIVHWTAKFTRIPSSEKANLDGIFLVKLNKKRLCTLFRMWCVAI